MKKNQVRKQYITLALIAIFSLGIIHHVDAQAAREDFYSDNLAVDQAFVEMMMDEVLGTLSDKYEFNNEYKLAFLASYVSEQSIAKGHGRLNTNKKGIPVNSPAAIFAGGGNAESVAQALQIGLDQAGIAATLEKGRQLSRTKTWVKAELPNGKTYLVNPYKAHEGDLSAYIWVKERPTISCPTEFEELNKNKIKNKEFLAQLNKSHLEAKLLTLQD